MTGQEVKAAYDKAAALVKAGKHDEARQVDLYPTDRKVIEKMIADRTHATGERP